MKHTRVEQLARALTARAMARKNGLRDVRVPLTDLVVTTTVGREQVRDDIRRLGHRIWERMPRGWSFEYPTATGPSVRVRTAPLVRRKRNAKIQPEKA